MGINKIHPSPIPINHLSSEAETLEACKIYSVKPPPLNADLFEKLLRQTDINEELQVSLVRGWREGFDLGSELPEEDPIVDSRIAENEHSEVLRANIDRELELRRLCGPYKQPVQDIKWFSHAWVSPYFVIPKKTPVGEPQK